MNSYQKKLQKSIQEVVNVTSPGMDITPISLKFLNHCLSTLNDKLIEECRKTKLSKKFNDVMPLEVASKALNKHFIGEMRKCARAHANMSIGEFNSGILVYVPFTKKVDKMEAKKGPKILPVFQKSISGLTQIVDPEIRMHKDAKTGLALILQEMCKSVVAKSQETSRGNGTLKVEDIIEAVEGFMGPTMAQHAISEGARNVVLFNNGLTKWKLEDFNTQLESSEERAHSEEGINN